MKSFLKQEVNSALAFAFIAACATSVGLTAVNGASVAAQIGSGSVLGQRNDTSRPCIEALLARDTAEVSALQAHAAAMKSAASLTEVKDRAKAIEEANKTLRTAREYIASKKLESACVMQKMENVENKLQRPEHASGSMLFLKNLFRGNDSKEMKGPATGSGSMPKGHVNEMPRGDMRDMMQSGNQRPH